MNSLPLTLRPVVTHISFGFNGIRSRKQFQIKFDMASGKNNHNTFVVGIGFHLRCNRQGCYLTNGQQLSMVYTLIDHRSDAKVFKTYHVISVEEGVRGFDHRKTAQKFV